MKNERKKPSKAREYSAFALLGQVGFYIAGGLFLGAVVGAFIDKSLLHDSTPIATLIGLLLGLAVGIFGVFRLLSSME